MDKVRFYIDGDYIMRSVPVYGHNNICRTEPVMDRKTFEEAYNKWIKGSDADDGK